MTRIWEVTFRENYNTDSIFDREKVTARTAVDALKKAKPFILGKTPLGKLVATDVKLIAEAR